MWYYYTLYIFIFQECWRWVRYNDLPIHPSAVGARTIQTFRRLIHPSSCRSICGRGEREKIKAWVLHVREWPVTPVQLLASLFPIRSLPRCPWCILIARVAGHHCKSLPTDCENSWKKNDWRCLKNIRYFQFKSLIQNQFKIKRTQNFLVEGVSCYLKKLKLKYIIEFN